MPNLFRKKSEERKAWRAVKAKPAPAQPGRPRQTRGATGAAVVWAQARAGSRRQAWNNNQRPRLSRSLRSPAAPFVQLVKFVAKVLPPPES